MAAKELDSLMFSSHTPASTVLMFNFILMIKNLTIETEGKV